MKKLSKHPGSVDRRKPKAPRRPVRQCRANLCGLAGGAEDRPTRTVRFGAGRGFSVRNLETMRLFYLAWPLFPLAFVARQKRLRVGTEWYRVDLVFFHRRLRCLVVVDLKLGKFTHADADQVPDESA